jgi:hypothetical protein
VAIDKLSLYNEALRIIGERRLSAVDEAREPRYELDSVWNLGAVDACLEIIKPRFATVVDKITVASTSTETEFAYYYSLPTDYVAMVQPYSDARLDEPITRFLIQGRQLAADQTPLYLRYISRSGPMTEWSPSFARFVGAYLAMQIGPRIKPADIERINATYEAALSLSRDRDAWEEASPRAKPRVRTLTTPWFQIYNDAMHCMGLPQLISVNDDAERRVAIDAVLNTGAVEYLLENTQWHWANTSMRIDNDPGLEPEWGYRYGFNKPTDMARIAGVFSDEYMRTPIRDYTDEGDNIFCDLTTIYLHYVSEDMLTNPLLWPMYFRKLVAAYVAREAAGRPDVGGDAARAAALYEERLETARNNDAIASPPRQISNGNWTRARTNYNANRRRP